MSHHQPVRTSGRLLGGSFYKVCIAALSLVALAVGLRAQDAAAAQAPGKGTIEGRVLNMSNGKYLSKAVVAVSGTTLTTLTNDYGEYTLRNVPAGTVTVSASFTGQEPTTASVVVEEGKTVNHDFGLSSSKTVMDDGTIVLDQFIIASERFKNAQEIAAHEERYSTSIKNVVSTDSLGFVPDGNVAEFVRFLPGIQTLNVPGTNLGGSPADASQISVRGFGPTETTIYIDGMEVASANSDITRASGVDMLSINNASRIEILKVATPDMPNNSSGGAINLVTKSAFEYARPTTNVSLYANLNTKEPNVFSKEPGPLNKKTYHTLPGGRVSVAVPINSKLGFTVSLSSDNKFAPYQGRETEYQNAVTSINLTSILGPDTANRTVIVTDARGVKADLSNPYLKTVKFNDQPWNTFRQSGNIKVDWKPVTGLILTGNLQYSRFTGATVDRNLNFTTTAPTDWSSNYTTGRIFQAPVYGTRDMPSVGSANMTVNAADKIGQTRSGYLKANYAIGPWTISAAVSSSIADSRRDDAGNEHFSGLKAAISSVGQVSFAGISDGLPSEITVKNKAGGIVNYSDLSSWTGDADLQVATLDSRTRDTKDTYQLDVRRDLDFLPFSMAVKSGVYRKFEENRKWGAGTTTYKFTRGTTLTTDDTFAMAEVLDDGYHPSPGFGMPEQQWLDLFKVYSIYQSHPDWFDANASNSLTANNYLSMIKARRTVEETNDAFYAMVESKFFNNRLSIVAGVRGGRSKRYAVQAQEDTKWNYLKNPDGTLYRDSVYMGGVKFDYSNALKYDPTGATTATTQVTNFDYTTDTELVARLRAKGVYMPPVLDAYDSNGVRIQGRDNNNITAAKLKWMPDRELRAKRTNPIQPQVQVAYELTKKIGLQASWSRETSLPPLDGSTSTNGILGSYKIDENSSVGGSSKITVSNPNLPPQKTNSYNFRVGYYPIEGTSLTVSYYYKAINNITQTVTITKGTPEFSEMCEVLGIDEAGLMGDNWEISTSAALAKTGLTRGIELDWRQNFAFLGSFGSRFSTFVTYSRKDAKKGAADNNVVQIIADSADQAYSFGVMYGSPRWSAAIRGTYTDQEVGTTANTVTFVDADGVSRKITMYQTPDNMAQPLRINAEINYNITKTYSAFISGSNILNSKVKLEKYDAAGITPQWARVYKEKLFGVSFTAGINATF